MAKGYLDIKQLEGMKKAELQDLAKKLGVSDTGTVKELVARIATVEVDTPKESELTEEEKEAAEQAAKEQEEAVAGLITVRAVTRFLDKQLNQIKDTGEVYKVRRERAEELAAAGVTEIVK